MGNGVLSPPQQHGKELSELVLLIDDSSITESLIRNRKDDFLLEIVVARTAALGIQILLNRRDEVKLVFLSIIMPEIDGVECLTLIKDQPSIAHIPVYMLSTLDDKMLTEICMERGAEGVVLKPLRIDDLIAIFQAHNFAAFTSWSENKLTINQESKTSHLSTVLVGEDKVGAFRDNSCKTTVNNSNQSQLLIPGDNAHAFTLLDGNFREFSFPSMIPAKKNLLLLFIPSFFLPSLYESAGFLRNFYSYYDLLVQTNKVFTICISADLPFALKKAKERFNIPFQVLSDPSLVVSKRYIGIINYLDSEFLKTQLNLKREQFNGPNIGILLLNKKREVLNKWTMSESSLHQFPRNFTSWFPIVGEAHARVGLTRRSSYLIEEQALFSAAEKALTLLDEKETNPKEEELKCFIQEEIPGQEKSDALRVLLIVENNAFAINYRNRLALFGILVDIAYNGKQGYELLLKALHRRSNNYCVIFCDLLLPIVNGIEFLGLISREPELNCIPVIILSQFDSPEISKMCRVRGARLILTKPFSDLKLRSVLEDLKIL